MRKELKIVSSDSEGEADEDDEAAVTDDDGLSSATKVITLDMRAEGGQSATSVTEQAEASQTRQRQPRATARCISRRSCVAACLCVSDV